MEGNIMTTDKAIQNAIFSLSIEGYQVDNNSVQECRKLLEVEITWEQYMEFVKREIKNDSTSQNVCYT